MGDVSDDGKAKKGKGGKDEGDGVSIWGLGGGYILLLRR